MIFKWFDATEAKKFGSNLALFFVEGIPSTKQFGDKAFELKAKKVLNQMAEQIVQFLKEHKLNTYKKAQLANAFKWTLKDAGIESAYTDKLTQWLMMQIG
jgi:hypothetical protein